MLSAQEGHVQKVGGVPGKAMFGPGCKTEVGWRCGASGWGVRRAGVGGSSSIAEPDVFRALTGVAESSTLPR